MSGRSAYVRKKITETSRSEGLAGTHHDDLFPVGELAQPSAEFSTRPSTAYDSAGRPVGPRSASGGLSPVRSIDSRSPDIPIRPLDDFAYARARKPTIRADDMTGISKSGVRSAIDRKSDNFRRGLSKAFGLGGKKTKIETVETMDHVDEMRTMVSAHEKEGSHRSSEQIFELPGGLDDPPMSQPPSGKLPDVPSGITIKRWIGSGRPVQRWNKLRKDPEIWDPNGDVVVYLSAEGQSPDPSMRLSSHIIEATDSRYLITMLREGAIDDMMPVVSSVHSRHSSQNMSEYSGQGSVSHMPIRNVASHMPLRNANTTRQPSSSESDHSGVRADGQTSYELYFPPPPNISKAEQIRHQITTRNIFALLCRVSLVGVSLHQALSDLQDRLDQYMPRRDGDNLLTMMSYICARGIDDVRHDAESAVGLLAWCEDPQVRWVEVWREAFVHAAGMFATGRGRATVESCADYRLLSPITKALLERASLEAQLRVHAAEERLAAFSFGDMWPQTISRTPTPPGGYSSSSAKDTADRMQQFFLDYYRNIYGRWPPPPPVDATIPEGQVNNADEPMWLTRTVAQALQKDMGSLYEYLVNRDIIWNMSETRPSRKWLMESESGNKAFEADTIELPMTDILIEFDNRHRFPHIPHPYPLVPDSVPAQPPASTVPAVPAKTSTFSSKKNAKNLTIAEGEATSAGSTVRSAAVERRVQLAYTESTNIYVLSSDFAQSDLIDAYVKFEKTDHVNEVDPSVARRARWVVIYGILQTLASVSVDAPAVRHRDDVPYHLSPQLHGARIPPWSKKSHQAGAPMEAAHELSHCWVSPMTWGPNGASASDDDGWDEDELPSSTRGSPEPMSSRLPMLSIDQVRQGYGVTYPAPLTLSSRSERSRSSTMTTMTRSQTSPSLSPPPQSISTCPDWAEGSDFMSLSQSNTRATTPLMGPTGGMLPRSTPASLRGDLRLRGAISSLAHKPPRMGQGQPSLQRMRVAEGDREWAPMRMATGEYNTGRREPSLTSDGVSLASSFGGPVSRYNRRKNVHEFLGMDGTAGHELSTGEVVILGDPSAVSPEIPDEDGLLEEYGDLAGAGFDAAQGAETCLRAGDDVHEMPLLRRLSMSSNNVAPMIRDFDELNFGENNL